MRIEDEIRAVLSRRSDLMATKDIMKVVFDRRFMVIKRESVRTFQKVLKAMPDVEMVMTPEGIKRKLIRPTLADKIELNTLRLIAKGVEYYYEGVRLCRKNSRL